MQPDKNPYSSPEVDSFIPSEGASISIWSSITFVFGHPQWLSNLLYVALGAIIPVVGVLVALGYSMEVFEYLHRRLGPYYPLFTFNRFGEYLTRGVWPFVMMFLANFVFQFIAALLVWIPLGIAFALVATKATGPEAFGVAFPLAGLLLVLSLLAMQVVLTPLLLRAGLTQDFGQTCDVDWIGDFLGKMWIDVVIEQLGIGLVFFASIYLSVLCFCVGPFFVIAASFLMQAHLNMQIYELYLARGGRPIPIKPSTVEEKR